MPVEPICRVLLALVGYGRTLEAPFKGVGKLIVPQIWNAAGGEENAKTHSGLGAPDGFHKTSESTPLFSLGCRDISFFAKKEMS